MADSSCKQLIKSKEVMLKSRQKYYQNSATLEKSEKGQTDERATKNLQNLRNLANKASEEYIKTIENVNKNTDDFDHTVPEIMKSLQQNEESRIHFVKSSIEKFIKLIHKNQINIKENFDHAYGLINNVNTSIDIKVFVDVHKGKYKGGIKEEFISYQK